MLTPKFSISQNDNHVVIQVICPFAKICDTDIFIEDYDFKFYSTPYYLRLTLPGKIVEDDRASAIYDSDKKAFIITVPKCTPGECFEGLDMLTRLLAPPTHSKTRSSAGIEVIDSENAVTNADPIEEFDWFIDQSVEDLEDTSLDSPKYGFANKQCGLFQRLQEEMIGLVDLPDPDSTPMKTRASLRNSHERLKFDEEHYLADLYESDIISGLMQWKPWWLTENASMEDYTVEETEKLLKLPRNEYILDTMETKIVYLSLVDILLAWCYDYRTTEGEHTVESGWTISKLSSTLSWFQTFHTVSSVVSAFMRRSLTYPLYRHWKLSQLVIKDLCCLLTLGKKAVLKALLSIHNIMIDSDMRYVFNDLYITDYCIWIQSTSDSDLTQLAKSIKQVNIAKEDVNLDLNELETAAYLVQDEKYTDTPELDAIQKHLTNLQIDETVETTDSDDVSSSDESKNDNEINDADI